MHLIELSFSFHEESSLTFFISLTPVLHKFDQDLSKLMITLNQLLHLSSVSYCRESSEDAKSIIQETLVSLARSSEVLLFGCQERALFMTRYESKGAI